MGDNFYRHSGNRGRDNDNRGGSRNFNDSRGYPGSGGGRGDDNRGYGGGDRSDNRGYGGGDRGDNRGYGGGRGRGDNRGFSGGGRGDGRGSGGGGRGGRGRGNDDAPPRPYNEKNERQVEVYTNFFPIKFKKEDVEKMEVYQYHVKIVSKRREFCKDANGEYILDERKKKTFDLVTVEGSDLFIDKKGVKAEDGVSSDITRAVLLKCQKDLLRNEKKCIYTDGSSIVFTLEPLFTEGEGTTIQPPNKKSKIDNYYAPQPESSEEKDDIEDAVSKSAASTTPYWEVAVYLENDDEEIYFSRKNYGVRFTQSAKLTLSGANREHKLLAAAADKLQILNFLNIAVKNSMMKTMKTFDKKSTHFYPRLQDQNVLMNSVRTYGTPWVAPVTGIRESAHLLGNDNLVLMANYCINWATRKEKVVKEIRGRVTILGVEVGDGRREVSDDTLERIVTELKKIRFHIEYDKGDKWVQMMKEKHKDDREIEKGRRFTKKGSLRLFKSIDETPSILKTAYDEKASFEVLGRGEGEETKVHTQATYYEQKGVKVEYPYLPIVRVSKGEWFPIEFLTQAFGPKKMANENAEATRCALQFNDEFTGTRRVFQTQKLVHPPSCIPGWNDLSKSAKDRTTFFDKLNLEVEQQPYKIPAAVLKCPNICFENKTMDGKKWNTNQVKFERPASLTSFAVVNFISSSDGRFDPMGTMSDLFEVCSRHGMDVDMSCDLRKVIEQCKTGPQPDRENIRRSIANAIQHAKREFLYRRAVSVGYGYYFKTFVETKKEIRQVLIDHSHHKNEKTFAVLVKNGSNEIEEYPGYWQPTHVVNVNGEKVNVRLKYKIRVGSGAEKIVDIFDFKHVGENQFSAIDDDKVEHTFSVPPTRVFQSSEFRTFLYDDVTNVSPIVNIDLASTCIECPSVIFFILPDKDRRLYSTIKEICRLEFGVQSQCFSYETLKKQRNPDQYFSGIALKLNAKLSNIAEASRAWKVNGHQWVTEAPTFIMGYSMASEQGRESRTAIAAAAILDSEGLTISEDFGIQVKSSLVDEAILRNLTKSLMIDFCDYRNEPPERVLIYRQGGVDGLVEDILAGELHAIREGIKGALEAYSAEDPLCFPLVTFAIAQSQHGVQIVPAERSDSKANVESGTCVDLAIQKMFDLSLHDEENGELNVLLTYAADKNLLFDNAQVQDSVFDFQLIPQHGLKGTSKPVHYRCIWNENYLIGRKGFPCTQLGKSEMENLTFGLSFQYGTATKSTRLMSVLHYADKLANGSLGYIDAIPLSSDGHGVTIPSYKQWMSERRPTSFHVHQTA